MSAEVVSIDSRRAPSGPLAAIDWATSIQMGNPSAKSVLKALARFVGPSNECWPSIERLAGDTDLSRSSVIRCLALLVEVGLVERSSRANDDGRVTSNMYLLRLDRSATKADFDRAKKPRKSGGVTVTPPENGGCHSDTGQNLGVSPRHPGGVTVTRGEGVTVTPEVVIEEEAREGATTSSAPADDGLPIEIAPKPAKKSDLHPATEQDWDEFWQAYPRKVGKRAARAAFAKAVRKVDKGTLTAALARHKTSWTGKEAAFIPHAATWLNGERWDDEVDSDVVVAESIDDRHARWEAARRAREERSQ